MGLRSWFLRGCEFVDLVLAFWVVKTGEFFFALTELCLLYLLCVTGCGSHSWRGCFQVKTLEQGK